MGETGNHIVRQLMEIYLIWLYLQNFFQGQPIFIYIDLNKAGLEVILDGYQASYNANQEAIIVYSEAAPELPFQHLAFEEGA